VSRSNPSTAQRDRPVINAGDAQLLEPLDSGDNIYQRIHRAHFVQWHLICRKAMDPPLRLAEESERLHCPLHYPG